MIALGLPMPATIDHAPPTISPGEALLLPRMPLVFINPEIVSSSPVQDVREEGCLSVPGIFAPVKRPVSVILHAQLPDQENINIECGGMLARAMQHEIDHLDGILFVDRLEKTELKKIKRELDALRRQSRQSRRTAGT